MKYILAFLSLVLLAGSHREEVFQDFEEKVNEAYSEYVFEEYVNQRFGIKLVKGLMNGEVRYGFCFYSEEPGSHYVRLSYKGKIYVPKADSRGDVEAVALNLREGEVFSILVYDSIGNLKTPLLDFQDMTVMSKQEFEQLEEAKMTGRGNGAELTSLRAEFKLSFDAWFLIGAGAVILICALIVFIFFKKRKGLFDKEIRSENVFNFKEFLSSTFSFPADEQETEEDEYDGREEDEEEAEEKEEEPDRRPRIEEYPWSRREDEESGFNIAGYLREKGFITDYNVLSESEKNQIMLELMRLRDEKKITKDEYLEEIMKLWKK